MLLSLYASFRWARKKNYVLKMTVFIILVSFPSAVLGWNILAVLWGPFPFLSFPFYAVWSETMGPPLPPDGYGYWIDTYQIRLLTEEIYSIDPVTYGVYRVGFFTMEIGSLSSVDFIFPREPSRYFASFYLFTLPFLFFMLVNLVGALLGFWLSGMHIIQKSKWRSMGSLGRIALGIVILGVGIFLSNLGVVITGRNPPWGGDYYTTTIYPYREDAAIFVMFGITWLAIILGERVWRKISENWYLFKNEKTDYGSERIFETKRWRR